jgi:hypothetical protein
LGPQRLHNDTYLQNWLVISTIVVFSTSNEMTTLLTFICFTGNHGHISLRTCPRSQVFGFKRQWVPGPFRFNFDVSDMGGAFLGDGGSSRCHLETNHLSVQAQKIRHRLVISNMF